MRKSLTFWKAALIRYKTNPMQVGVLVIHNNYANRTLRGDTSFKFLTYQLLTVGYWPTVALTGNGELGFDSGEEA